MAASQFHALPVVGWIFDANPIAIPFIAYGVMTGVVVLLAYFQHTLNWNNPALYQGDIALAISIGLGGWALRNFTPHHVYWFERTGPQLVFLVVGIALGLILEWIQRFRVRGLTGFMPSDAWHLLMFGPMAYWVVMSIVASIYYAGGQGGFRWVLPIVVVVLCAFWLERAGKSGKLNDEQNRLHHSTTQPH